MASPETKARTGQLSQHELDAGHKPHGCTDILCVGVLIGALVGLGWTVSYARTSGDLRRLYHGLDFTGNLCGVDQNVTDKPYVYWCAELDPKSVTRVGGRAPLYGALDKLDLEHPICVKSCPTTSTTSHSCFHARTTAVGAIDPATGSFKETVTYDFRKVKDVPTFAVAGRYCMPQSTALMTQAKSALHGTSASSFLLKASEVANARAALLSSAGLAFLLGYIYLYALEKFASLLVHACLLVSTIFPIAAGAFCIYASKTEGVDFIAGTGDPALDLVIGSVCILLGAIIALITCFCRKSISLAIGCVEAACECMFSMPSLLLEPLLNMLVKLVVLALLGAGLALLLSCGEVRRFSIADYVPGGISRTFSYTDETICFILYYIFVGFWLLELSTAFAQFVLCYSVQLWYFQEYVDGHKASAPRLPIFRGYFVALRYHLGTLAFGAFLLGTLRFVRAMLTVIWKQAQGDGNSPLKCVAACCACCITCFESCLRALNKSAYVCVAIDSDAFCTAAHKALKIIVSEVAAISVLHGACWIFVLAGIAAITSACVVLTWFLVTTATVFTDPASAHFVGDPLVVVAVAGVVCLLISAGFMVVFDTVADTILFCWSIDREHRMKNALPSKDFAPPRLKRLLKKYEED